MEKYKVLLHYHASVEVESWANSVKQALVNSINKCYFNGLDPVVDVDSAEILDEFGNTVLELEMPDGSEEWVLVYKEQQDGTEGKPEHRKL